MLLIARGHKMNKTRRKKFFSYFKPYKGIFIKDMLAAITVAIISLIIPLVARYITNTVLLDDIPNKFKIIMALGVGLLLLSGVEFFCNRYIMYMGHVMGARMERDVRKELFEHYQKLSFSFYDNTKTGQLLSRITSDLFALTELYHHGPEDIVLSVIKMLGAFLILIRINTSLTLILFAFIPVIVVVMIIFNKKLDVAYKAHKVNTAKFNERVEDNLSGIRVVKSFSNENYEIEKFGNYNDALVDSKGKAFRYMSGYHSIIKFITTLLTIIIIIIGSSMILNGDMILGDLVAFLLYINNFVDPIKRLVNFNEIFQDGLTGFSRFMDLMETQPDIQDKEDAYDLKDIKGIVKFKDVSFKYKDNLPMIFKDININVSEGEYVALVGSSGAGKSTMLSLIPRFYDTNNGDITIDDHSIKDVTLSSLRKNIGIVQQDVYLFSGTVRDNIGYGKDNATDQEITEAAILANADEFIKILPNGYDTDIGQNGVKLSGGQKQRLSIARVFLKNPPILIFDEATSSLDNESEKVVQDSLENLAKDRTTFVIAHRLSTIKNAKRIIVLDENGICEEGNHLELLSKNGTYAHLYNMQFLNN
jgi:ATP-binding cassette subfamily B protein